ncbi:MAG: Acylphosphatase [Verrucomicrobiota bacterium]|jgi:acylphosphatase
MNASVTHATVYYSGHVQGVGFRYTTLQVAKEFEVAGWVKNLADGRVQVEVEGRAGEVEAFIAAVGERMHGYIKKCEQTKLVREASFQGFEIR